MVNGTSFECGYTPDLARCPVCQAVADKKCSGCHKVSYCSSDHQKQHWKTHKNECRIFIVKRNEALGRFLVATRDIPQGTIIFTEEPLAWGPKRCTQPVCLGCHERVDGSYRCSKCTYPMCSEKCEQAAIHAENECVIFQRGSPVGSKISNFDSISPAYECITPLRCLLLKERNPTKWEKLVTMEHHNELRKTHAALWNRNFVNVAKLLLDWYKLREEFDEETVHSVLGYIDVNCFEIKYKGVEICGVFRDGGLMCHDCVPNTHHAISVTDDHKMIVRASVPIKKGEMITTSYADQLVGTRERRWFLKDTKYFSCLCRRCNDPSEFSTSISAIKCTDCTTGYLLPKDPLCPNSSDWSCTNAAATSEISSGNNRPANNSKQSGPGSSSPCCTKTMKEDQVQNVVHKARKDIEEVRRSTAGSPVSRCERLLKKYSGKVLHPNHYLLLGVIKNLNHISYSNLKNAHLIATTEEMMEALDVDHLSRSRSLCLQLLGVLDMLDPGLTRLRGVTLHQLSVVEFHIARIKYQSKEVSTQEYKNKLENILAYLQTSREILELDTLVIPNAHLFQELNNYIEFLQNTVSSLHHEQ